MEKEPLVSPEKTPRIDSIKFDSEQSCREKLAILRKGEKSKKLLDINYRVTQLKLLKAAIQKNEKEIHFSNKIDLGQSEFMSYYLTYNTIVNDIDDIINNIWSWSKPQKRDTPAVLVPGSSYVVPEPFGVSLTLSAWNSQYLTLLTPIAQAIAAGNQCLAKPSEMAEVSAVVCQNILAELDPEVVQTCQGGVEVCVELLKNKFDIIIFTGSPEKGRLVALAAAEFLTPCILELGGQNPCVVDETADLKNATFNLLNGKCLISGQICLAPEYVMIHRSVFDKFVEQMKTTSKEFYGGDIKNSADYSRIINKFHTERLIGLIERAQTEKLGKMIYGGESDINQKYVAPTLFSFDSIEQMRKSELAKAEIFGPIQYIAPYDDIQEVIDQINSRPKPLTMYYFGNHKNNIARLEKETSSGAFVTNDCIVHFTNSDLPFGGVGKSGYGAYHGKWGFESLSHMKPVLKQSQMMLRFRYPPFPGKHENIMRFILPRLTTTQYKLVRAAAFVGLLIALFILRNTISGILFRK
jgi:aldehyde dehydrogenase (NAD+)